jgi:hypothetical protein
VTFDFDDFSDTNHKLERLHELREINPAFRCTVFAVPALSSDSFLDSLPRWIELAVHGWLHPHPRECANWTRHEIESTLDSDPVRRFFVNGWKSPGWQTSDAIYEVLAERHWWIADQHLADDRRPEGLRTYLYEDGDNWHGHIQDVCGNGIEETWPELSRRVAETTEFRFASEMAR